MPRKRSSPVKAAVKAVATKQAQGMCPRNHRLPNQTPTGSCTPLYCGADAAGHNRGRKAPSPLKAVDEVKKAIARRGDGVVSVSEVAEAERDVLEQKLALVRAKREHFGVPHNLEGADAEAFIDRKLVSLGVDAVAELEEQLKLGNPDERFRAAARVLDAIGRGKREQQQNNGPVIMLVQPGQLPWQQPIEGVVVKKDGNGA